MFGNIQNWLIKKVVGSKTVIINAQIKGSVDLKDGINHKALITNTGRPENLV